MNANRKASLQRKLAVAPVPKPPAGLAARIKKEIPKELRFSAERERERLTQSVRFSVAVAASVIVVIASAYLALQVTTTNVQTTSKPAAATPLPRIQTPALPAPALVEPQRIEVKQATRVRAKKQEARRLEALPEPPPAAVAAPAASEALSRVAGAAAAPAAPAAANAAKEESTISPISGKVMSSEGMRVLDSASVAKARLTSWRDTSPETKIRILKEELARGAEPGEVARVAREAGLNEFADSIEKKQQH
jgi:hypothetical protein